MGSQTPFSGKMGVARVPRTRDPGPGLAWNSGQTGSDPVGKTRPSRSIFRDSRKMDRRGRVPISRKWGPGPPRPPRPDPPGPSPGLTLPTLRVRPRTRDLTARSPFSGPDPTRPARKWAPKAFFYRKTPLGPIFPVRMAGKVKKTRQNTCFSKNGHFNREKHA